MTLHPPGPLATYKKVCVDAVDPLRAGPGLASALHLDWRPDGAGEGGLVDPSGRYVVWVNAVADAGDKTDRVRLDVSEGGWQVTVSTPAPGRLAAWWATVLGDLAELPVRIDFVAVGDPQPGPARVHWDVATTDLDALLARGATLLRARGDDIAWHVLADPDGNPFCAFDG